ncbi:MAG: LLM class flavin-dependent oxidoreductase [Acidimicrobiales bacterium]|jgi:alkanesulfonate monooxygenase SsuD/methylene tetrahydromethanopterin reductase-like flavin-dependent oxidoreductase (luciferase family)
MRHGVFLPPFNELSDPHRVIDLAVLAEQQGWDGFFLWDHVLRRPEQAASVADPWIILSGVACATTRLRIGTMVTPLVRRRPQVLVRQVVTLDHLSSGRVVLGLGLGVDSTGELSRFGEVVDAGERGAILDEGAELLARMMEGEYIEHRGPHFTADGVRFLPRPLQTPRVPIWFGAQGGVSGGGARPGPAARPVRRAARYDGLFLVDAGLEELERAIGILAAERDGSLGGFQVAVLASPTLQPAEAASLGATWAMLSIRPEMSFEEVRSRVADGPPR